MRAKLFRVKSLGEAANAGELPILWIAPKISHLGGYFLGKTKKKSKKSGSKVLLPPHNFLKA